MKAARMAVGRRVPTGEYYRDNLARKANPGRAERKNLKVLPGGLAADKSSKRVNVAHLMFMVGALVAMALTLYRYVSVQSALEGSVTTISALEKQLASMKQENDEAYSRANSTVDLEEVKRVAIQELGMKYADQGQIVVYSDDGAADYVRQLAEIPEAIR